MSAQINDSNKITLAGGGLVGAMLALVLARKGYQVEVFESRPDLRKTDISAGKSINLALANRGIKPLQALGLMDDITPMLIPMSGRMVHVPGKTAQLQAYGQQPHEVIYSISRGELNALLLDKAEATGQVTVHFEHRIKQIDFEQNQLHMSTPQGDKQVSFTRLFGTDGANSPVREAILSNTTDSQLSIDVLDHSYKELHIAPNADGSHKLEKNALHIWPRGEFMTIALPNLDGSFTVTLFMPSQGQISFESINTSTELQLFFNQHFSELTPYLDELEQSYFDNPTGKLATVKCAPWYFQDQAFILGDAAHAVVPFHGQGMNCGFEDCNAIIELLPNADDSEAFNWQAFFVALFNARKANADAIADMALENYIEMRDSVMQAEFLKQKQIAFQLQQWFGERFTPRYGMVMFEHRPYAEAYELGKVHKQLMAELSAQIDDVAELNQEQAETILTKYQL